MIRIVWDEQKSRVNRRKHRVSFVEAAQVFFDPLADTINDPRHPAEELRFFTIGQTYTGRLLSVAHTQDDSLIRVITARDATATERRRYEDGV